MTNISNNSTQQSGRINEQHQCQGATCKGGRCKRRGTGWCSVPGGEVLLCPEHQRAVAEGQLRGIHRPGATGAASFQAL